MVCGSMNQIRVLIADANSLAREGVRALLPDGFVIVDAVATGIELVAAASKTDPDVCIVDAALGDFSGVEAVRVMRLEHPERRVVLVCPANETEFAAGLAGCAGVALVHRSYANRELRDAVEAVLAGLPFAGSGFEASSQVRGVRDLTARQLEILRMVAQGRCNKEIARDLEVSVKTVEFHRGRIMDRMGVRTIAGLTRAAISIGLLPRT